MSSILQGLVDINKILHGRTLSADDDLANNLSDTTALINTLKINAILFTILIITFEIFRHTKEIYLKRLYKVEYKLFKRLPSVPSIYPFSWLFETNKINEDEFLYMVGLDGYMLMRYIMLCIRFTAFVMFWGLVCLTPLYSRANGGYLGWNRFTLANVPNDPTSTQLWAPAIFAYIFSSYFCYLLYIEYKNFRDKRITYFINADFDTPPQTYYTVLVEKIPTSLRSEPELKKFFETLFPGPFSILKISVGLHTFFLGQVFSVFIAVELSELDSLVREAHKVRNNLEKAVAIYRATSIKPTCWVSKDDSKLMEEPPLPENQTTLADWFGYAVVDAIDYYTLLLNSLNENIHQRQQKYEIQIQSANASNDKALVRGRIEKHALGLVDSIKENVKLPSARSKSGEVSLLENDTLEPMHAADESSHDSSNHHKSNVLDIGSKIVNAAGTGVEGIAKESMRTAHFFTKGALRAVLETTRAVELLTVGAYYETSSTGFVTFNTLVATSASHQMFLSHRFGSIVVKSSPNPKDIIWENIALPVQQTALRHTIADATLIFGAIFWSVVVGFITTISNLESLSQEFPWLQAYSNTGFYQLLNSYLAAGLLLILLSLLPLVFDIIARNYEGLKCESEIQNSIMTRYFYYQLANVFVSVGLGSIASSLHQIIQSPQSILSILGSSLPNLSIYFTNLVIVKTFTAVPIEMLRLWPLIQYLSVSICMDKQKCTARELRTGAFSDVPFLYGWVYPNIMMVLMILMTYSCIAPLIAPFCLIFFVLLYMMYKYQLLYVFVTEYQSGGFMWYAVFSRSLVCAMAGVSTLICYLGIRETFFSGPFYLLLPLPILLTLFWHRCDQMFKGSSLKLSLEASLELDKNTADRQKGGHKTSISTFNNLIFKQPSLVETKIFPEPYVNVNEIDPDFINRINIRKSINRTELLLASKGTDTNNPSFRNTYIDNFNELSNLSYDENIENNRDINAILNHPEQIIIHTNMDNIKSQENSPFIEITKPSYGSMQNSNNDNDTL